jgi:hypothetical protein
MTKRSKNRSAARSELRRLRVGVTLYLRDGPQSLWENGIFQNCFFLLMLLRKSPAVERCCVVAGGPGAASGASDLLGATDIEILTMQEACDELDVVIELSAQLDPEWGRRFVDRGGRIVGMRVANDFIIDAERMAFGLLPGLLMSGVPYHEIWTLPAFERTCAGYYAAGYRAPVRVVQHLWSPFLIEQAAKARPEPRPFEYAPGRRRWRIAVLEPNICSVKTCHIPLLACDVAHRMMPSAIDVVRVFNAMALKENQTFVNFARSTNLVRQGLATFEGRYPLADIMGPMADAIVSHHWENAQNYLYYEALHGGFPLIHNSPLLDGCGYRYENFDPQDGGRALIQALLQHDRNLEAYRSDARRFLSRLDPTSEENVRAYSDAIAGLFADRDYDATAGWAPAIADAR